MNSDMGQQSEDRAVQVWTWDMLQAAALPMPHDNARGCIVAVHAHPDDEASKGAATIARYHDEGVTTVLVTCTGGEAGSVLNPLMQVPQGPSAIASVRREELIRSAQIIGYDHVILLGFRDSGLSPESTTDSARTFSGETFSQQHDEAVRRLMTVFRLFRPDVVITYPETQDDYPHPDHLQASAITRRAFDAVQDAGTGLSSAKPRTPAKLYEVLWPDANNHSASGTAHRTLSGSCGGGPTCCTQRTVEPTAKIEVTAHAGVVSLALLAHASQLTLDAQRSLAVPAPPTCGPLHDDYVLVRDYTGRNHVTGNDNDVESDLFSGCRPRGAVPAQG